jgi:SH3 domain
MSECAEDDRPKFHNYLRAFYPFHPSGSVSPSTVTLPLNQGDIILVHSVHVNGWADGTLLETGERGWLPTNYCEAYDQLGMRPLLKALTDFWDIIRGGCGSFLRDFGNQDLMRGLIAGVRFLLVSFGKDRQGLSNDPNGPLGESRMFNPRISIGSGIRRIATKPQSFACRPLLTSEVC